MSEDKKIYGNVLIAIFMGAWLNPRWDDMPTYSFKTDNAPSKDACYNWGDSQLQYDKDWGWLMPVVQKIYFDNLAPTKYWSRISESFRRPNLETTWQEVVEFIKFYNSNPQQKP